MSEKEKLFLGVCIKKYRQSRFLQSTLTNGICSKYTLSRLENGTLSKTRYYHALLHTLGYHYNDTIDMVYTLILIKRFNIAIETYDFEFTMSQISALKDIIDRNENHIYFVEMTMLHTFLKTHYIENKRITFTNKDLITLSYHEKDIRICIKHVLCENMMFYKNDMSLSHFVNNHHLECERHILCDYFLLSNAQYQGDIISADALFKNHKHLFIEENNFYQSIRFHLMFSLAFIKKNRSTALQMLNKAKQLHEKTKCCTNYIFIYYYGMIVIHTQNNEFEQALVYAREAMQALPHFYVRFLPFLIILSQLLNEPIEDALLADREDPLCLECIALFQMHIQGMLAKDQLNYINLHLPQRCSRDNTLLPIIYLLRKLVVSLTEQSHYYQRGLKFDVLVKNHTNEKEFQL